MTDRPDMPPNDPNDRDGSSSTAADDRVAAAEHRAAAAEHRAHVAEDGGVGDDRDRREVVDRKPTYGLGSLLALAAAAAIALSTFLNWAKPEFGSDNKGFEVPLKFLWDPDAGSGQPSLLWVLLGAAIAVAVGTFIPRLRVLAIIGGVVALATAVLFFISATRVESDSIDGALDLVDIGMWLAAAGGLVAIIGSLIIPRRPTDLR